MKQETNNEIDLLLRRLGRSHSAPASHSDLHVDTDHLDADELSAYAENAVPGAARVRYTEHLAECARCRDLVVQLSSAAGVVASEPSRVSEPSGLRKFLASLFSPMVLRYAIPAMGLAVVAVIGLMVFRSDRRGSNEMAGLAGPQAPVAQEQVPAPLSGALDSAQKPASGSPVATHQAVPNRVREGQSSAPDAAGAPTRDTAGLVNPASPAQKTAEVAQPVVTAEAPPPQEPKPTPADAVSTREPEARRQEAQGRTAAATEEQAEKDRAANQAKAEDKREVASVSTARAKKSAASPAPAAGAGASTGFKVGDTSKDRDDSAEARTVAGRRFRKLRGVWVDTAYHDGAITNVRRGSEQYRGLVADEPGIKTIAEQLDGHIIVVWKGRAYRIQ